MSTNLYWEPNNPPKDRSLSKALKYIFGPRYWNHDGSCYGEQVVLNEREIPYLSGINDATGDKEIKRDIATLIEAIQKYGSIKISIRE